MSTLHYYYNPQNCLYQGSLFQSSFDPKMNFHRLFTVHGPGSPEKSLGTNPRWAGIGPAVRKEAIRNWSPPNPGTPAHRSVVAIRQRLVLCGQQRGRLPLPYPARLVRGSRVGRGGSAGDRCGGRAAEHPHGQGVVGELCRACRGRSVLPGPARRLPVIVPF